MNPDQTLLRNRFKLVRQLYSDAYSETWLAADTKECQPTAQMCIVRLWPFDPDVAGEGASVLWSREERRMRRLAGSAGAEESLMTLILSGREEPAGQERWYFVMVLKSSSTGYSPLQREVQFPTKWLIPSLMKDMAHRVLLWRGLHRVATGVQLLHRQRILHRNISLDTIFWDPTMPNAPQTMRLGGFESSLRFGVEEALASHSDSEVGGQHATSFPMDWFRLGVVLACVFGGASIDFSTSTAEQLKACEVALAKQGNARLTPRERVLIQRLLTYGANEKVVSGDALVSEFVAVEESLHKGASSLDLSRPLALVFNPFDPRLSDACKLVGFQPGCDTHQADQLVSFRERDLLRQAEIRAFLRKELTDSRLYRINDDDSGRQRCVLVADKLCLLVASFEPKDNPTPNMWEKAYVIGVSELKDFAQHLEDLKGVMIEPLPLSEASRYSQGQPWKLVLPSLPSDQHANHSRKGAMIHHFLRSTNLLDLLLTTARIFPYVIIESSLNAKGDQTIVIEEGTRLSQFPTWTNVTDGLAGDLRGEMEKSSDHRNKWTLLTATDELQVRGVRDEDWWTIDEIKNDANPKPRIVLTRRRNPNQESPPIEGFIRSFGLYGLFTLIDRRKQAIDNMLDNTQLLRVMELADAEPIQKIDKDMIPTDVRAEMDLFERFPTRKAFFEDVDHLRPLYVLQGPPGTGKSTFVAAHLRRILDKNREPHSQILITAQAHVGVDVLREKVDWEFQDLDSEEKPLAIRLGGRPHDKDSIRNVSSRILLNSLQRLRSKDEPLSPQQSLWLEALEAAADQYGSDSLMEQNGNESTGTILSSMMQLLRRCANISYCTASAKDLAELAKESDFDNTYDLVIVEEAGKIHAFDLVLPMSSGYSWLLIGDHKQLPAFQIDNFARGLKGMDLAVQTARTLPKSFYIDTEWLDIWENWNDEERQRQTTFSLKVLRYFKWLHEQIGGVDGQEATTGNEAILSGAGRLSDQFRMPDPNCKLIGDAFYGGGLTTGRQVRGSHQLLLKLDARELDLSSFPIIWIDTPWCQLDDRFGEADRVRFNQREVRIIETLLSCMYGKSSSDEKLSLAVLTPYRQQLSKLNEIIGQIPAPEGFKFKPSIMSKSGEEQRVHTVDSFQGNEADVVIASLVRNNSGTDNIERTLGFLADPERMNVLLSRAVRQIIIVGSWDFFTKYLEKLQVRMEDSNHELWFLRSILNTLNAFFADGTALKLNSTDIRPIPSI